MDSNFPESAKCGVASSQFEWVPLSLELRRVLHTINSKEMESFTLSKFLFNVSMSGTCKMTVQWVYNSMQGAFRSQRNMLLKFFMFLSSLLFPFLVQFLCFPSLMLPFLLFPLGISFSFAFVELSSIIFSFAAGLVTKSSETHGQELMK
jgi:hypothetical protein